jgi:uncharacterized protein (TIGR03067 family)
MKALLWSILTAGLLVGVAAGEDDAKKEKEKLHGTWKVVSVEERGTSKEDNENHSIAFTGDDFIVKRGDDMMIKGKFKIDPAKKPMEIDLAIAESQKDELKGKTGLGIYSVDGDTLKFCVNEPGDDARPKEFSGQADTKHIFITCARQK